MPAYSIMVMFGDGGLGLSPLKECTPELGARPEELKEAIWQD